MQWNDTHHAFKLDERPYVRVSYKKPEVSVGVPFQAVGDIGNVGKTTALNIHIVMHFELIGKDQQPDLEGVGGNTPHTNQTGMLFPNAAIIDTVTPFGSLVKEPSSDDVAALIGGEKYVSIHGRVDYSDIFGVKHWTRICQWFGYHEGVFQAQNCGIYNAVDHN